MRAFLVAALALAAAAPAPAAEVLAGIDVLRTNGFQELKGRRVGLITNQTGKDRKGTPTAEVLAGAPGLELKALFSPEHGFSGTSEANSISSETYKLPDGKLIPVYSLYGGTKAPTGETLRGLDTLVFDIQDIGARFYTYATTMALAMEAAAAHNLDFFVLDRPNPITGDIVEGPVLAPEIRHFTAYLAVPVRHGMTMGELARLHNIVSKAGARLQVVPLKGWTRDLWYDQTGLPWTKPSPNMPDLEAATLYPGIGSFESTNLAVGRGTPVPFRWVGAPWFRAREVLLRLQKAELPGIRFELQAYKPTKSLYEGKKCPGIRMRVTDREKVRPLHVFAHLLTAARDLHPVEFGVRWDEQRRMTGNDKLRLLYENGVGAAEIIKMFDDGPRDFDSIRNAFLLY